MLRLPDQLRPSKKGVDLSTLLYADDPGDLGLALGSTTAAHVVQRPASVRLYPHQEPQARLGAQLLHKGVPLVEELIGLIKRRREAFVRSRSKKGRGGMVSPPSSFRPWVPNGHRWLRWKRQTKVTQRSICPWNRPRNRYVGSR